MKRAHKYNNSIFIPTFDIFILKQEMILLMKNKY